MAKGKVIGKAEVKEEVEAKAVDIDAVIEEVGQEIVAERKIVKKKVSRDELRQLEKECRLMGNTSIIDGFCVATYKEK